MAIATRYLGNVKMGRLAGLGPARMGRPLADTATYGNTKCMNFDGVDEYLRVTDANSLDITANLTVSAWVKASGVGAGGGIVVKEDYGVNKRSYALCQDFSAPTKMAAIVSADGTTQKYYASSITAFDGAWHHIAMTFSSNTLKMYVDGVLDASPTKTVDDACASIYSSDIDVTIGCLLALNAPVLNYVGKIDEPNIWNATLTAGEITELYNSGHPYNYLTHSKAANLVSWWRMGDGAADSITSIKDQVGTNHATPTNMEAGDITADVP